MTRSGSAVRTSRFSKDGRRRYRRPVLVAVATLLAMGVVPAVGVVMAAPTGAGPVQPPGTLKICKVAGSGVKTGTNFTFTGVISLATGPAGLNAVVPAGPTPGGYCKLAGSYPIGTQVSINESVPAADQVTSIATNAAVFSSRPPAGILVTLGAGVTEVTFTDASKRSGFLEICKQLTPGTKATTALFQFTVNGTLKLTVPAGACSPAINLPVGKTVVAESLNSSLPMASCSTLPVSALVAGSCDLATGKATVTVAPGDMSSETILTITDGVMLKTAPGNVACTSPEGSITFTPPVVNGGSATTETLTITNKLTLCNPSNATVPKPISGIVTGTLTFTGTGINDCKNVFPANGGSLAPIPGSTVTIDWTSTPPIAPSSINVSALLSSPMNNFGGGRFVLGALGSQTGSFNYTPTAGIPFGVYWYGPSAQWAQYGTTGITSACATTGGIAMLPINTDPQYW